MAHKGAVHIRMISLDFPQEIVEKVQNIPEELLESLQLQPEHINFVGKNRLDYLVEITGGKDGILAVKPDFTQMKRVDVSLKSSMSFLTESYLSMCIMHSCSQR